MRYGIQTVCNKNGEWMLEYWLKSLRAHNPNTPVRIIDYGMTKKAVKAVKADKLTTVVKCPKTISEQRQETAHTLMKALPCPWDIKIHADLDAIIQGPLQPLVDEFIASGKSFAGCGDPFYPWTWRPSSGSRHLPIMSGFTMFRMDSHVLRDWVEALTTWDSAPRIDGMAGSSDGGATWHPFPAPMHVTGMNLVWRDDMQCLAALYRIGHPDIWEMPATTQWFRLQGGEPNGYLVAHYTGGQGKDLLAARIAQEGQNE